MSIRKFNVNKTESSIALASALFDGFMSKEDKIALDALVAANFQGGSITEVTINVSGLEEVKERLTAIETKLSEYPIITSAMKTDNQIYAFVNGKFEEIAPADTNVIYYNPVTTATLEALESGRIPVGLSVEELEKVKANIPEDIWNELDDVATLELTQDNLTDEQKISAAIMAYKLRKTQNVDMLMPSIERSNLDIKLEKEESI